jgi:O-succinylbenzoate synthase
MKVWAHRYELKPAATSGGPIRQGALLKVEWVNGQFGFSDLHPWPEYGDEPLDQHLGQIASVKFTKLVETSLGFNYIDREYRWMKRSAFLGLILPRAHRLVANIKDLDAHLLNDLHAQGFSHVKVKMGAKLEEETGDLLQLVCSSPILWRLDMKGRMGPDDFTRWWNGLDPAVRERIDFVEDPVCAGSNLKTKGPWAMDWVDLPGALIRVVKPARDGTEELGKYPRVIFTHSLEHPFGQACSAWAAARYYTQSPKKKEVCGLGDPGFYQPNEFHRAWPATGPRMKPTSGTGFGFDELLAGLDWERVL